MTKSIKTRAISHARIFSLFLFVFLFSLKAGAEVGGFCFFVRQPAALGEWIYYKVFAPSAAFPTFVITEDRWNIRFIILSEYIRLFHCFYKGGLLLRGIDLSALYADVSGAGFLEAIINRFGLY